MSALTTPASAICLSNEYLTLDQIVAVARLRRPATLASDAAFLRRMKQGRAALERKLAQGEVVYGVNTGFGGNARL